MVAVFRYDSKVWAAGVATSCARESSASGHGNAPAPREEAWRALDRQLRSIAARRAALDAEELALIRKAIAIQIWRPLGMISMREYLEHAMGYGPQVAAERLRVCAALEDLPTIEAALGSGDLSYSAVRELTRIATHRTEKAWLEAARGKVLRQIEELVAEREPGDGPDAPPKPQLRPKRVSMDLRPEVVALMRRAHAALDSVRGERNDYNDLLGEAFRCLLAMHSGSDLAEHADGDAAERADGDAAEHSAGEATEAADGDAAGARSDVRAGRARGSARAQIATITKCEGCGQGWQLAAGRKIAITAAELETAECDAVHIGSLDGAAMRATSTIPPATRRQVQHRDGYKCTVPWCRAAANIDVHHIVHLEHGGGHERENLTSLCFGHHAAHHRGELLIEGRAPALTFRRRNGVPHVGESRHAIDLAVPHVGELRHAIDLAVPHAGGSHGTHAADALLALTTLGFTKREAERALAAAFGLVMPEAGLEPLLRAALRELR